MTAIRLGIIGCGDIGGWVALFARLTRGIRLQAACDSNTDRAAAFAARHRIPEHTTDYRALLANPNVDAVYIAVPHHLHHPMLVDAIAAGKPALIEKPVTRTLAEAADIVARLAASPVKVAVNYQYRYDPGIVALREALALSGPLRMVRAVLPWHRSASYFASSPWHASIASAGGGTLITQGSHLLDAVLWASDTTPLHVYGRTARFAFDDVEVEDSAMAIVELDNGAWLSLSSSMATPRGRALEIEAVTATETLRYSNQPMPHLSPGLRRVRTAARRRGVVASAAPLHRPFGLHPLQASLAGFRDWLVDGIPHRCPAASALPALAVVEGAYRSAASHKREPVKLC